MLINPTFNSINNSVSKYLSGMGANASKIYAEKKPIKTGIYLNPNFSFETSIVKCALLKTITINSIDDIESNFLTEIKNHKKYCIEVLSKTEHFKCNVYEIL